MQQIKKCEQTQMSQSFKKYMKIANSFEKLEADSPDFLACCKVRKT